MTRSQATRKAAALVLLAGSLLSFAPTTAPAQRARSLIEQEIETSEARTTLEALLRENEQLKRKLHEAEISVVSLQKNLAASNAEAEVLKRKISELMLRIEALGINATGEGSQLEQRLLKAVNDLRIAETDRQGLKTALLEIGEVLLALQAQAGPEGSEPRLALEEAARKVGQALGDGTPKALPAGRASSASSLAEGRVIAINDSLALVVANVGARHGLRIGMPLRILRERTEVGIVRVVDLRDRIAGAVVQHLSSDTDKIQVGDRLALDTAP